MNSINKFLNNNLNVSSSTQTNNIMAMFDNPQTASAIRSMSQAMQGMGAGGMDKLLPMLMQNNPQLAPIVQMLQSGGNPQQIVMDMLNKQGINPQEFMNKLQSMM